VPVPLDRQLGFLRITPEHPQTIPLHVNNTSTGPHIYPKPAKCQQHQLSTLLLSPHLLARYGVLRAPPPHCTANTAQLADVTKAIKSVVENQDVEAELAPAYEKYNEEQFTTTKLPGGSTEILVSPYNSLGDGRYYDVETQSSFDFDHATQKASAVQSYVAESQHEDLV